MTTAIAPFDPGRATDEEFVAVNALSNRMRAEKTPDDPPLPVEATRATMLSYPSEITAAFFVAWADGALVGLAALGISSADNTHLCHVGIEVLPECRRRGIGTRLLAEAVDFAEANERPTLLAHTNSAVPAGAAFLERAGGRVVTEGHVNQLSIATVDREQIARWVAAGEANRDYRLEWVDGAVADDRLDEIARVVELMNDQPFDDADIHAEHFTPERVRAHSDSLVAQGIERWMAVVRHVPSGELAGFTETMWRPETAELLEQGGTAVDPEHRGHGLGKWLKAAMVERVLRERPVVEHIRTGNANSNAAMLAINHQLGFRPLRASAMWQIDTPTARAYVDSKSFDR